jgi:hypothetical protein
MIYAGTHVTSGRARAVVVATGPDTEIGHIARLAEGAEDSATPLERRIAEFGRYIMYAAAVMFLLVNAIGLAQGMSFGSIVMVAVSQVVGMVPLPPGSSPMFRAMSVEVAEVVDGSVLSGIPLDLAFDDLDNLGIMDKLIHASGFYLKLCAAIHPGGVEKVTSSLAGVNLIGQTTGELHMLGRQVTLLRRYGLGELRRGGDAQAKGVPLVRPLLDVMDFHCWLPSWLGAASGRACSWRQGTCSTAGLLGFQCHRLSKTFSYRHQADQF